MTASWSIVVGDARERLRELPDRSVQTCVTSPPYFGLRDYGTGEWEGGDSACEHRVQLGGHGAASALQTASAGTQEYRAREQCPHCGARRVDRQIGLESSPQVFVATLVEVFREVRRVLRDDGHALAEPR